MADEQHGNEGGDCHGLKKIGEIVQVIDEGDVVDEVEIEIFAKENRKPPRARRYRIRVDKQRLLVERQRITGAELLALVAKTPDCWRLYQKMHGGHMKEIEPGAKVDLGEQGIERFTTMEKSQKPGEQSAAATETPPASAAPAARRAFRLPEDDEAFLATLGLRWETITDGGARWLLVHEYPVPAGYNHQVVTLAIRIEGGYPPAQLDMAYVFPHLGRADGQSIPQLTTQALDGKTYQRWSRHYQWREGVDNLPLHYLRVQNWLANDAK